MRCDAQVQYEAPVSYGAATITMPGVDLNRDGSVVDKPCGARAQPVGQPFPPPTPAPTLLQWGEG